MIIKAGFTSIFYIMYFITEDLTLIRGEMFTALTEMEPILDTYKRIIDDFDHYTANEEERLVNLKKHVNFHKKEYMAAMGHIPNYLGNPINAFKLIRRLTTGSDFIEKTIKETGPGKDCLKNLTVKHADLKYPTLEDLTGAVQALTRLQQTYHLNVKELAEGKINGVAYSTAMTADDCFEMGRSLYKEADYANSLRWMTEALRKFQDQDYVYNLKTEVHIHEYIAYSHNLLGNFEQALKWTNKLLALDPKHRRARINVPVFEKSIQEKQAKLQKSPEENGEKKKRLPLSEVARDKKAYGSLCRGELEIASEMKKKLKCSYLTENHPFLKLAPIKMEQVYIGPDIYLFHHVMSDDEIEHVKGMAKPRIKPAMVYNSKTGMGIIANFRISKSCWLRNEDSEVVARISRRVADFTGLSMDSAENLQVVNYGIGGHYEPHYDFTRKHELKSQTETDNRIATVMFYMSEVALGGATVFIKLGLSVFPVKNAAIFWMNLHPSGEGDIATIHAGCPVLRGTKWVSNKWINQNGQEFLKPCNLKYQREEVMRKIPRPVRLIKRKKGINVK